jgi:hypothetical protein
MLEYIEAHVYRILGNRVFAFFARWPAWGAPSGRILAAFIRNARHDALTDYQRDN